MSERIKTTIREGLSYEILKRTYILNFILTIHENIIKGRVAIVRTIG